MGLKIDGADIKYFSDVEISYSVSGYGTEGVCSQMLTFSLPTFMYGPDDFNRYDPVILTAEIISIPTFYLSDKNPSGNKISVTCYDRTIFADRTVLFSDEDITDDKIPLSTVISRIEGKCGFSVSVGDIIGGIADVPKDMVIGKTARDILSSLAKAAAGCFAMGTGDTLSFVPFARNGEMFGYAEPEKYSTIVYGMSKTVSVITLTDGSRRYSSGTALDPSQELIISTPLVAPSMMKTMIDYYSQKTYQAWGCDNMVLPDYIPLGSSVKFGNLKLPVNYLRAKITAGGMYASIGNNAVSCDGFSSLEDRAIAGKVGIGETNGSTKITRDGVKFVYVNENSETESEHGFEVGKNGITSFQGAIMDSVMPKSLVKISDTSRRFVYDGASYTLSWKKDASGNLSDLDLRKDGEQA